MFEFHGWASIHVDDSGDPITQTIERRVERLSSKINDAISKVEAPNRDFRLRQLNGTTHLIFCGDHNHRDDSIIQFFKELANIAPMAYGQLYVRDDEDTRGYSNMMRKWILIRGQVWESTDDDMSPCIPTLE